MGISVSGFKRGDIVILAEGVNGVYGKYHVCAKGGSMAVLVRCGTDGRFRYVLKRCSGEGERLVGAVSPHVLCESVLWGGVPGYVGDGDLSVPYGKPVDVVRVFPAGARREADKFFEAVVAARELLVCGDGFYAYGEPVVPLNSRLCNPHVVQRGDVDGVVSVLESGAGEEFEGFLRGCGRFRDFVSYFAVSEWGRFDAFMSKVDSESARSDFEYAHLVDGNTGVTPFALFRGDIVRVKTGGDVQYLRVVGVSPDGFKVKNLTLGCVETLTIESALDGCYDDVPDDCYRYSIVKMHGSSRAVCYDFMILPTRNPKLVREFDALYRLQGKLISDFNKGIMSSRYDLQGVEVEGWSVKSPDGFTVKVRKPDLGNLLEEISSLASDAERSGSIMRLENLKCDVINMITSRVEEEERKMRERFTKLREALEAVAALND